MRALAGRRRLSASQTGLRRAGIGAAPWTSAAHVTTTQWWSSVPELMSMWCRGPAVPGSGFHVCGTRMKSMRCLRPLFE
eukprot:7814039-Lingulodinium_polyedra.AAC.1